MPDAQFSDEFYVRWQHLLEDIDMNEVPLEFVREISVNMTQSATVSFDISEMKENNLTVREIEHVIESFLRENNEEVENIEFHINIKAVADEVTGRVSKILD